MKKVKNFLNASEFKKNYEKNSGIGETIPDQALTPREIITRFTLGSGVANLQMREPLYEGDEGDFIPDINTLDISEIHELRDQYREKVKTLQREINEKLKAEEEARINADIDKKFNERLKLMGYVKKESDVSGVSVSNDASATT